MHSNCMTFFKINFDEVFEVYWIFDMIKSVYTIRLVKKQNKKSNSSSNQIINETKSYQH